MSERIEAIRAELLALRTANGLISATEAVRWARENEKSHLHAALLWDDAVAGERYRVWQVRELVSVHIVDAQGDRQFVSLSIDRQTGGYRPVNEVMERVDLREVMVADALAELEKVQKRYDKLTELSTIWAEAGKVRQRRSSQSKAKAA